jgi:hypothetical protein
MAMILTVLLGNNPSSRPLAQPQSNRAPWRPTSAWNSTSPLSPENTAAAVSTSPSPTSSFYGRPPLPSWTVRSSVPYLFNEPGSRSYIDDHSGDRMMQVRVSLRPIPGLAEASEARTKRLAREKAAVPEFRIVISRDTWIKAGRDQARRVDEASWLGDGVLIIRLPGIRKVERVLTPKAREREEAREREKREGERREVIYQAQPREEEDIEVIVPEDHQRTQPPHQALQDDPAAVVDPVVVDEMAQPPFAAVPPFGYPHPGFVPPPGMVYPEQVPTPPVGYPGQQAFYAPPPQQMYYPDMHHVGHTLHHPQPQQAPSFFMPARGRRIEIKAPTPGQMPGGKQQQQNASEANSPAAPRPVQPPPPSSASPYGPPTPEGPPSMPPGAFGYESGGAVYFAYPPVPQSYYYPPQYYQHQQAPPPPMPGPPATTAEFAWQDPSIVALGSPTKEGGMMPPLEYAGSWLPPPPTEG